MTDNEPLHMSFDNLPRAVAELHSKIDTLTEMVEKLMSANVAQPLPEIMTVEDVSGKSSVSCPLKPSDSAPLKHSTMPP